MSRIARDVEAARLLAVAVAVAVAGIALAGCSSPEESSPALASATGASAAASATSIPSATPTPTPSAQASITPEPSPTPSPTPAAGVEGTYLALGDSLAVGVGASRPAETGYVGRLYAALATPSASPRLTALQSLARSGETSGSMIRTGQLVNALEVIATADPPIALVTLDIGGNDLLALLRQESCAADPNSRPCLQLLALTLADFETNYRLIVGELLEALATHAPGARLAVMTYFNPSSGADPTYESAGDLALVGADGRIDCDAVAPEDRGMNDIIVCVGEELGAVPVDVYPRFVGLGLELTHIGDEDIHANDQGYAVIADTFLEALAR